MHRPTKLKIGILVWKPNAYGIFCKKEYVFLPQTITDEEGNDNYAALIIRKDNPQFADLVSEFMATVNLLNTKPEDFDE